MSSSTIKTALMTSVYAGNSSKNYEYVTKHGIGTASGGALIDYLYFSRPFPIGATIMSARIVFYTDAQSSGTATHTITATRLKQTVSTTKVTYKTRPTSLYPGTASVSKTAPWASGAEWSLDVTAQMQSVANGEAWYGWQLTGSSNPNRNIYGPHWSTSAQRPRLEVTWSMLPQPPAQLSPAGGRLVGLPKPVLRATYTDVGNDNVLAAVQVQRADAGNDFTTPTWDSGVLPATSAQLDTATTSWPALTGPVVWWRMRVQDTNGIFSPWSTAESFGYDPKAALEILNPGAPPNDFVTEDSPPIVWAFPSMPEKTTNGNIDTTTYLNPAAGTGGAAALTRVSSGSWDGSGFARLTWTTGTTAASGAGFIYSLSSTTPDPGLSVTPGLQYDVKAYVRPSVAQLVTIGAAWYDSTGTIIGTSYTQTADVAANTWTQVGLRTPAAPANAVRVRLHFYGGSPNLWPTGSTFDLDSVSVRQYDGSETQSAYQVTLVDPTTGARVWTSGKVTSASTTAFSLPPGYLKVLGAVYRVVVLVWDSKPRETTPGDTAYVQAQADFTYNLSALTPPTLTITATADLVRPKVSLLWTRATFPDSFTVLRNGVVIASELQPGDVFVSGTSFTWTDPAPLPNIAATYQVAAVVNGKSSSGNPTAVATVATQGMWLADKTRTNEVLIVGRSDRQWTYGEQSEVLEVIGGTEVIVVTHAQRGLEGSVTGQLRGGMFGLSTTAADWKAAALAIKAKAALGQQMWLTAGDATLPVIVRSLNIVARPEPVLSYDISFEFYQVAAQ